VFFLPPVLAKADLEVLQFLQMSKKKQLMSENGSYIQTTLISRVRKHPLVLEACHGHPEEFGLFCHSTRPNKRIDNGRVNTFELTISHLRGTVMEPGIVVFAQFKGFISNSISITVMSPGGDSSRADPTNYLKIGSNLQFECNIALGANQGIHGSWLISVADTEATDTGSMLEMWGIKAIVRRQNHVAAKSKNYDSMCEPTTSQLNARNVYPPLVVKFQPVCDRCYKVYKRLESEMSQYDAQQRKIRLKEAEEARKLTSKEIVLPNFRHCSDPLSVDIQALLPQEEPLDESIFETGASKFGMSSKRYRHALAKSVAEDRGQPASPPKFDSDRPVSRHNNFEARMARLLVRSPQTRSSITANMVAHANTNDQSQNGVTASESPAVERVTFVSGGGSVSSASDMRGDAETQGRVQSWSERHQEDAFMLNASNVSLKERRPSTKPAFDVISAVTVPISNSDDRQPPLVLPPLSTEHQRPKSTTKAPLLSVGAALERKLAGNTSDEQPLLHIDSAPQQDHVDDTALINKQPAASAISSAPSLSRDRQYSTQDSSSFSFQKSFQEP